MIENEMGQLNDKNNATHNMKLLNYDQVVQEKEKVTCQQSTRLHSTTNMLEQS